MSSQNIQNHIFEQNLHNCPALCIRPAQTGIMVLELDDFVSYFMNKYPASDYGKNFYILAVIDNNFSPMQLKINIECDNNEFYNWNKPFIFCTFKKNYVLEMYEEFETGLPPNSNTFNKYWY